STVGSCYTLSSYFFFFQAEDGIRDFHVTGVQTCALPIYFDPAAIFHGERRYIKGIAKCVLGQFRAIVARAADIGRSLINACEIKIGRASCRERVRVSVAGE